MTDKMRPPSRLRAFLYPLLLIPALALVFIVVSLCRRNGELPPWLVNSRWVTGLAERLGVRYSIKSLHAGCFQKDCRWQLDATGLELLLPDLDSVSIGIDSVHWCPVHPLSIRGLNVRTLDVPELAVADVEFFPANR